MEIDPIDVNAILGIVMGSLIVLIPIVGLTARFALKPVVEAIARAREAQGAGREAQILEKRMALLEQQVHSLETSLGRLEEDSDFRRQLGAPSP